MNLSKKTTRKISVAVGVLGMIGLIILGLGPVWGFEGLANQISVSIGVIGNGINVYFLGVTSQKSDKNKEV